MSDSIGLRLTSGARPDLDAAPASPGATTLAPIPSAPRNPLLAATVAQPISLATRHVSLASGHPLAAVPPWRLPGMMMPSPDLGGKQAPADDEDGMDGKGYFSEGDLPAIDSDDDEDGEPGPDAANGKGGLSEVDLLACAFDDDPAIEPGGDIEDDKGKSWDSDSDSEASSAPGAALSERFAAHGTSVVTMREFHRYGISWSTIEKYVVQERVSDLTQIAKATLSAFVDPAMVNTVAALVLKDGKHLAERHCDLATILHLCRQGHDTTVAILDYVEKQEARVRKLAAATDLPGLMKKWQMPETMELPLDLVQDSPATSFRKGKLSQVFRLTAVSTNNWNKRVDVLCKSLRAPDAPGPLPAIGVIDGLGVDRARPQVAERNLASSELNQIIGELEPDFPDVIVETGLMGARLQPSKPVELAIGMQIAPGKPLDELTADQVRHPEVRRQLTALQLLDGIAGQCDRHGNNVLVHFASGGEVGVTGIDNDQSWGNNTSAEALIRYKKGFKGTGWPRVIDQVQSKAMLALTAGHLGELLGGLGLDPFIKAATARLDEVQNHIRAGRIRVIPADGWAQLAKSEGDPSPSRSYDGRRLYQIANARHTAPEPSAFAGAPDRKGLPATTPARDGKAVIAGSAPKDVGSPAAPAVTTPAAALADALDVGVAPGAGQSVTAAEQPPTVAAATPGAPRLPAGVDTLPTDNLRTGNG